MPLRLFSRGSPKIATNSSDTTDVADKDHSRSRPFPLQEVSWNSLSNEGKTDFLNTPQSVVKWLSSTPLPDPPFIETQENLTSEKVQSSQKTKLAAKDSRLKFLGTGNAESTVTSLRSSASSNGLHDILIGNLDTEQKVSHPANSNLDPGLSAETQLGQSLKYSHATTGAGTTSQPVSCASTNLSVPELSNSCTHFEIEEDPNFWKDHNVQVVIRLRPLSSSELATQGHSKCIRQDSANAVTWTGHPESRFTFDLVACETITQEKIFKVAGLPMVDNCLMGYNSCMFAYGQTGSGKTFTMLGDLEGGHHRPSINRGMTPRVFEYLFSRIQEEEVARKNERLKFMCKCSFLEIYNEQILDLLDPATANLQMREDAKKGVYVENLSEVEVKNVQDVITLLVQGAANRKVAATNMNRESSRSHSVFTCVIESKWTSQSVKNSRYGRLNLVDLAGSERQKSSGAEGDRLKEAANINKSLSTLGLVIMSLVDIANGKQRHVPYRDSKLTFLLHDSLGGNSKTTIIANISPSKCCALETLSTLKFAQRAKFIRNNAIVNENALGDVMALRLKIQRLEEENNRLRMQNIGGNMAYSDFNTEGFLGADGLSSDPTDYGSLGHSTYSMETWDPFRAFGTSNISSKQRKGLELALKKSLQREQVGEARIRQLQAEIEQFKCLVKQREEDTQSGKMMLRFREDKIKRMESVLRGLTSTDTYLNEERDSLLEEVQILRNRLERNPEVTRFAMENIRLQEELHRYQVFYEAGERDMMEKEISILQEQLLEALDWKLMHEQDPISSELNQSTQPDGLTKEKISFIENEVNNSKLEKQIETVGAVASMQAELIAMRDAVVAAKKAEAEAREQVALLIEEVAGLQRGLRDLQKENDSTDIKKKMEQLENENVELRSICESGMLERQVMNENFNRDLEFARQQREREIQELGTLLLSAEEELKKIKIEQGKDLSVMHGSVAHTVDEASPSKIHNGSENLATDSMQEDTDCLQSAIADVQSENSRLLCMYNSVLEEKECMSEELKLHQARSMANENEMEEIRSSLKAAEEALQNMRLLHSKPEENSCIYDSALEEHLSEELNLSQARGMESAEEIKEVQSSVKEAEQAIPNMRLMHLRPEEQSVLSKNLQWKEKIDQSEGPCLNETEDANSCLREIVTGHCIALARMEAKLRDMLQKFESQFDRLQAHLGCAEIATEKLGIDDTDFMARFENMCTEMMALLDANTTENKRLQEELDQTTVRLKEAERGRDDDGSLHAVEKGKWVEERRKLQERIETSLCIYDSKEKAWNDCLKVFQLKLDLVESKLLDLSSVVDGAVSCMENKWRSMKESLNETFLTVFKVEKETQNVEETHHAAQIRLHQLRNKLTAMAKLLDGSSKAQLDWCSREQRLEERVQMLSVALADKEMESFELKTEEDNLRSCLDQLMKHEEILTLEMVAFKEKLHAADHLQIGASDHSSAKSVQGASFSMLQLLRGQEEKATLLSVIAEQQEKLKVIKADIESMQASIDKKETTLLWVQVERDSAASSLQEAEAELEEVKREKQTLIEAEAGLNAEFKTLMSLYGEAEAEEAELLEQLEGSRRDLQELKERLTEAEGNGVPSGADMVDNVQQQNKSRLTDMLEETHKYLLEIRSAVEEQAQ